MDGIKNKDLKFSKPLALSVLATLGVLLLAITYYLAYDGNFYNSLFWISVLLFSIPIFLIILDENVPQNHKILLLFLFGTILYIMRILPSTIHFHFGDELAHFETAKLIYEAGTLDVATHFEISKYYPGLGLLTVSLKYLTNLDIFPVAKILIGVIHSFVVVFIYLFFKEVSLSERIAAIGAFIYATNPLYIFFHAVYSYESLGILFVVVLLYLISKMSFKSGSIFLSLLAIVILPALVITHHLSSYMFLLFMVFLAIIQSYKNLRQKSEGSKKSYLTFTFLTGTLILGWMVYVATIAINYLFGTFTDRLSKIFELSLFGGEKTDIFSTSLATSLLPTYEFVIDTFIYVPLVLLLSLMGVYFIKKEKNVNAFIYTLIFYGPVLYLLSLGLIPTSGSELAQRSWGFVYIGLSFVIAVALDGLLVSDIKNNFLERKTLIKAFSFIAVIIILMGGVSIGDKPIHREPDLLSPKLVAGAGSMTTDVFCAAEWVEREFGKGNKMSGDPTIGLIYNRHASQEVELYHAWKLFLPKLIDDDAMSYVRMYGLGYVVIDERMTKSLAEYGYYFPKKEIYREFYPVYGLTEPLPIECIEKFNNHNLFYKIYDNENIYIYKITHWW